MKRGFTLLELLAVIVILAIIALISVPIVVSIIDSAKLNSERINLSSIERAINLYYKKNIPTVDQILTCTKGICKNQLGEKININGTLPDSGTITISPSGKINFDYIIIDGHMCEKISDNFSCRKKSDNLLFVEDNNLTINSNKNINVINYRIYGNSVQGGIPNQNNPSKIDGVGNVVDLLDENLSTILDNKDRYADYTFKNKKLDFYNDHTIMGFIVPVKYGVKYRFLYDILIRNAYQNRVRECSGFPSAWGENYIKQTILQTIVGKSADAYTISSQESTYAVFGFYVYKKYDADVGLTKNTIDVENLIVVEETDYLNDKTEGYKIPITISSETSSENAIVYMEKPLRKLGVYTDYLDFYNKTLVRNVEEIAFDGSENWVLKKGIFQLSNSINCSEDRVISKSTHFVYDETRKSNFWIDNLNRINIKVDGINNLADFKLWLKEQYDYGNPVTIYYPLKQSIITNIEEKDFPPIIFEGSTNIFIDTIVEPSKIILEYN